MSESNELQFVDTNMLIYAHDRSAGAKHQRAKDLLQNLWQHGNGCLSIQVLQEFYVNITRKVAHPLTAEEATNLIEALSVWTVHQPDVDDILAAIRLQTRFQLSFWDAMVVTSAIKLGCAALWSEDLSNGQTYASLRVVNPFV